MTNEVVQLVAGFPTFERIVELEEVMIARVAAGELEHAKVELTHFFAPGIYVRQVRMPAGASIVGKIHATEHVCIVSCGRVISFTELDGEREIVGPTTFVTPAGTKRALHVEEDCTWATVHPTTLAGIDGKATAQDLAAIEDTFIAKSREEFLELARSGGLLWLG